MAMSSSLRMAASVETLSLSVAAAPAARMSLALSVFLKSSAASSFLSQAEAI